MLNLLRHVEIVASVLLVLLPLTILTASGRPRNRSLVAPPVLLASFGGPACHVVKPVAVAIPEATEDPTGAFGLSAGTSVVPRITYAHYFALISIIIWTP